jgi:hypothetical protein
MPIFVTMVSLLRRSKLMPTSCFAIGGLPVRGGAPGGSALAVALQQIVPQHDRAVMNGVVRAVEECDGAAPASFEDRPPGVGILL